MNAPRVVSIGERSLAAAITARDGRKRAVCPACWARWGTLAICPYSLCPNCRTPENQARLPRRMPDVDATLQSDIARWERAGWDMSRARALFCVPRLRTDTPIAHLCPGDGCRVCAWCARPAPVRGG